MRVNEAFDVWFCEWALLDNFESKNFPVILKTWGRVIKYVKICFGTKKYFYNPIEVVLQNKSWLEVINCETKEECYLFSLLSRPLVFALFGPGFATSLPRERLCPATNSVLPPPPRMKSKGTCDDEKQNSGEPSE